MLAIISMLFQDSLICSAWSDRGLHTASGLRAIENELGGQVLVGFGAPGGSTADGNLENFARRRQTGLRHGRVSLLAAMCYITLERPCRHLQRASWRLWSDTCPRSLLRPFT